MRLGARCIPIEYYILRIAPAVEPSGGGKIVGYLGEQPIFSEVTDSSGGHYHYVGLAPRLGDGRYDVESLSPGEWIIEPGLIYKSDDGRS